MAGTLATSNGGAVAPQTGSGFAIPSGGGSLVTPSGTGAVGVVAISLARMSVLLEQAHKAFLLLQDLGVDLRNEATVTDDMVQYLTASLGERMSVEHIRVIAGMLTQIADGSLGLVAQALDAVRVALVSNMQVQVAQEGVHATGADGGYIDSQRRVG